MYSRKCYTLLFRNQHVRSISLVENFPLVAQSNRDETASLVIRRAIAKRSSNSRDKSGDTKRRTRKRGNVISATCISGGEMVKRSHAVAYFSRSCCGGQGGYLMTVSDLRRKKNAGKYRR